MIERPAPSADYLDRPEVRSVLRTRPTTAYLGACRGAVGYTVLVVVAVAAAVEAGRLSPWLGVALALVPAQALLDWLIAWHKVGSFAYQEARELGRGGAEKRANGQHPEGPPEK
jgi:hypothetical protein